MHEIEEQEKQSSVVSPPAHATQPTRAGTPKSAAETTPAATVKVSTVSPLPPAGGTVAPPKSTPGMAQIRCSLGRGAIRSLW